MKTHSEANLKYMDLEKKSRPPMPNGFRQLKRRRRSGGSAPAAGLRSVFCRVLLPQHHSFCKDNNETALEVEQDILNSSVKTVLS